MNLNLGADDFEESIEKNQLNPFSTQGYVPRASDKQRQRYVDDDNDVEEGEISVNHPGGYMSNREGGDQELLGFGKYIVFCCAGIDFDKRNHFEIQF